MRSLLLVFLCIGVQMAHAQSGWTRPKGTYFAKVACNYFSSSKYYNLSGNEMSTTVFKQQGVTFYGEYGLLDRLTAVASIPLLKANGFASTETVYGIGDLHVGLKYALLKNKGIPLTISIAPEIPTGSSDNYARNKNNIDQINLSTGDGEFNVWTTLAGSASLGPQSYMSLYAGYNYRTAYQGYQFRDQLKLGGEVGYKVANVVWVTAMLQTLQSLGEQNGMTDFVRGDGTAFTAFGFGAAYEFIKHWSINTQVSGYSDLLNDRRNIYSAPTYSLGVFYEVK